MAVGRAKSEGESGGRACRSSFILLELEMMYHLFKKIWFVKLYTIPIGQLITRYNLFPIPFLNEVVHPF
jgi:hypothetical protein